MDIATLVKNITTAFEDASALVQRIRTRKEQEPNVQNADLEPIDDLLSSLSLGPTVVRGYYESDARRFGNAYMTGDSMAREQLKDSLINLQMTVLSSLGAVIFNDRDPDYDAIQAASDECRVNVGVCLGQLSQRMSRQARGFNVAARIPVYDNGQVKTLQRSESRTRSSTLDRPQPMTPPESETEYLGEANMNGSPRKMSYNARSPEIDARDHNENHNNNNSISNSNSNSNANSRQPSSYGNSYANGHEPASVMPLMYRGPPPTGPLPRLPDSPISPQDLVVPGSHRARASLNSMSTTSTHSNQPSMYSPQPIQETFGSNENFANNPPMYLGPQRQPYDPSRPNYGNNELTSATWTTSRPLSHSGSVDRKPVPSVYDNMVPQPLNMGSSNYRQLSIPQEEKEVVPSYAPAIVPDRALSLQASHRQPAPDTSITPLNRGTMTSPVSAGATMTTTTSRTSVGPLNLPTEKNLLGFCKGAFRLQCGIEKKAFSVANRPMGLSNMLQYWKCQSCYFEGPCTTLVPPGKKKPEKIFDPVIRDYDGIRYKWAFLAKCHVTLKTMPEGKRDGSFGSFCCLFCTAEAAQRGWPVASSGSPEAGSTTASTRRISVWSTGSNNNNSNNSASTLVFGSIHGFMDHLQMHRQPEFWPGVEMQGRMKCVVGKIAQRGEEFDVNLMPLQ